MREDAHSPEVCILSFLRAHARAQVQRVRCETLLPFLASVVVAGTVLKNIDRAVRCAFCVTSSHTDKRTR